ncbi:MAG: PAS domain S-box protein [Candidatus Desulfaltia sp.]|nr:PAS domain S-box protein [Candidatus Desulfaltia sp.]
MAEKPTFNKLNRDKMLPEVSLSQLQTAFDAINEAVCLLDMNGKILRCNKAMESLLKKSSGEIIGGICWELIHGTDKPVKDCPIVRMKKTLRRETLVLKVDDKWLNVTVDPVIDEKGNLAGAVHIISDITQHKKTEQALRESEAKYSSFVEHTGTATAIIEEDSTISMANTKLADLIGYSIKEIQGKMKWTDFIAEEDIERMKGYHVKRREHEGLTPNSYEFLGIDKQRNIKNILLSIGVIPGTKRSVASLIDITHIKQIEASLQESERRLKKAIEGNPIPTFIIDDNHTITHWNKACEILTGFSASEVVGTKKQWSAFYSEERPVMADFIAEGATEEEMAERYKHIVYNKSVLIEGAYEGENFYPDLGEKGK